MSILWCASKSKGPAVLEYKIAHDPDYADLIIDHNVLRLPPENGSVADRILNNYHATRIPAKRAPLLSAVHIIGVVLVEAALIQYSFNSLDQDAVVAEGARHVMR
jgi:hypothetical protein